MEIKANTIGEAHLTVCKKIFMDGTEIISEDGEITYEYPEPIMIRVKYPFMPPMISKFNNFKDEAMVIYKDQFTSIMPVDDKDPNGNFAYTYGNRMLDYPIPDWDWEEVVGDGDGNGFDQVEWAINKLIESPDSRRVIIVLRDPEIDCDSNNPPCLTTVQFLIRDHSIHTIAYFRSNDMLSAWCNNANGLAALADYVGYEVFKGLSMKLGDEGEKICGGTGSLTTISASAHIYFYRDAEELKDMKRQVMTW